MARTWNVNVSVNGGNDRGAFGSGNVYKSKGTLDSEMYKNQDNGDSISSNNLKGVMSLGLAFNTMQKGNEVLGAYTENRLRQRKINVASTFVKYGIGIAVNAPLGLVYAGSDMAYRSLMYGITVQKQNQKADYYKRLSGNNSLSGSRYRGAY